MPIIKSSIQKPFDPSTLKAEVKNATIGQLVDMLRNDLIDLTPEFQRNPDLWNKEKKSQLIESILLGLPLPSFYFYIDDLNKKWVVIDGLQRLCALKSFMIDRDLSLTGLEFLDEKYLKKKFTDFDYFEQLSMSMHPVTLNVLTGDTSAEARYIIFQRVNSKGTSLNPVEMRNALYRGKATGLISDICSLPLFEKMVTDFVSTKRMKDKGVASQFITFYVNDIERENWSKLDLFIGKTMDEINHQFTDIDVAEVLDSCNKALHTCKQLLGIDAFRNPIPGPKNKKKPLAISLFVMLNVSLARLTDTEREALVAKTADFKNNYMSIFEDPQLLKYLSDGTAKKAAILYRFNKMHEVISNTLSKNDL